MQYKDIIGHGAIKEQLKNVVHTEKISHGYLFDGPDGIGKSMVAHAFASSILCDHFTEEPCGNCKNCHLSFGNSHPDIIELDLTIDKNGDIKESISVDAVRELKKDVYIKPFFADRKIYIIKDAQKMTVEAQNALLKIFEEPPKFATFILLTAGLSKLLPTILSRGVIMRFQPLSNEELELFVKSKELSGSKTDVLIRLANGRPSRLQSLMEEQDFLSLRDELLSGLIELCRSTKRSSVNRLFLVMKEQQDKILDIIEFLNGLLSDVALVRSGNPDRVVHLDKLEQLKQLSELLNYNILNNLLMSMMQFSEGQAKNQNYLAGTMNLLISMWEEIHG